MVLPLIRRLMDSCPDVPLARTTMVLSPPPELLLLELELELLLDELVLELLLAAGYHDVGMDHFAKAEDDLYMAKQEKRLHRNFMGYTTNNTKLLIGLGVSAISDAYYGYMQNVKTVEEYYALLKMDELPIVKGYFCTDEDVEMRKHILNVACTGKTAWNLPTDI